MIPDLGKYAEVVLSAYGVSLVMLVIFIIISFLRGRRIRVEMRSIEERRTAND